MLVCVPVGAYVSSCVFLFQLFYFQNKSRLCFLVIRFLATLKIRETPRDEKRESAYVLVCFIVPLFYVTEQIQCFFLINFPATLKIPETPRDEKRGEKSGLLHTFRLGQVFAAWILDSSARSLPSGQRRAGVRLTGCKNMGSAIEGEAKQAG